MIFSGGFLFIGGCVDPSKTADSPELVLVDAELVEEGVKQCAQPELRAENPISIVQLGLGWEDQDPEGFTPPEGSWIGGEGLVVADFTGNGLLDIFVPTRSHNLLFIQESVGVFSEQSMQRLPYEEPTITVGASAGDMDGDGDLDILVLNVFTHHQLLRNDDGIFQRLEAVGLPAEFYYSPSASWGDIDGDSQLELFINTSGRGPTEPPPWEGEISFEPAGPNRLYQYQDGRLEELPLPHFEWEPYSCCSAILDINLDGHQDVYVVNDFGAFVQPNLLLLGSSDGVLEHHHGSGLDIGMFGMGLSVGAINDDAYPDFVVTDWGRNWLLLSDGDGGWYDATISRGLVAAHPDQKLGWGTEIVDVDNDGDLDVWIGFGQLNVPLEEQGSFDTVGLYNPRYQPDALYLQDENGSFFDVAEEWGIDHSTITRGGLWVDLNRDGFLDFLCTAVDGPVLAYLSQCDDSAWLEVSLSQPNSNRFAVGSTVEIWSGEEYWKDWVLDGSELSSSGPMILHFGLGNIDTVDRVRVVWPDNTISQWENIATRQFLQIHRQ